MRYGALFALAALIMVTACGGSATGRPAAQAAAHTAATAAALARRTGCTHWKATIPPGLYTRTEGGCTLGGQQAVFATFGDIAGQRAWVAAETSLGGFLVQGSGWAANAPASADAKMIAAKLGGHASS